MKRLYGAVIAILMSVMILGGLQPAQAADSAEVYLGKSMIVTELVIDASETMVDLTGRYDGSIDWNYEMIAAAKHLQYLSDFANEHLDPPKKYREADGHLKASLEHYSNAGGYLLEFIAGGSWDVSLIEAATAEVMMGNEEIRKAGESLPGDD